MGRFMGEYIGLLLGSFLLLQLVQASSVPDPSLGVPSGNQGYGAVVFPVPVKVGQGPVRITSGGNLITLDTGSTLTIGPGGSAKSMTGTMHMVINDPTGAVLKLDIGPAQLPTMIFNLSLGGSPIMVAPNAPDAETFNSITIDANMTVEEVDGTVTVLSN